MSKDLRELLLARVDEYALRGEFRVVGDPAALVANELIPADFFPSLRRDRPPDGYVFGAGCGNAISTVEAFAATPRGMILVDVDPAVVYLGHVFVAALRRHATPEAFVEGFFCRGRKGLEALAAEALPEDDPFGLAALLPSFEKRAWSSLAALTESFSLGPQDARRVLAEWASHHPPKGRVVPVRTWIARNYAKLRELAVRDRIVVLRSTVFDPVLLETVAALPGFATSRHAIYLSNVVDHLLRRAVFRSARWKMRLSPEPPPEDEQVNTTADFLALLEKSMRHLEILTRAAGDTVFVHSSEGDSLRLEASRKPPRYAVESFYFQFDLDVLSAAFLSGGEAPAADAAGDDPWAAAAVQQATARALYSNALRARAEPARRLLESAVGLLKAACETSADDDDGLAFQVAEITFAALFVERGSVARELAPALVELRRILPVAVRRLEAFRPRLLAEAGDRPTRLLLWAQALVLAGRLLDEAELAEGTGSLVRKAVDALGEDGRFRDGGADDLRFHAEALARLVFCNLYRGQSELTAASERGCRVLDSVHPHGPLRVPSAPLRGPGPGDGAAGRLARLSSSETFYENARMALLFHGLSSESFERVHDAMRLYAFSHLSRSSEAELSKRLSGLAPRP